MVFRRFAHWLLLALGLFVLIVLLVVALETGMLGEDGQAWLREQYAPIEPWYTKHKTVLETGAKYIGGAFSAVFALFAVYKSYHYAEFNLADRVVEFVKRTIKRAIRVRQPLITHLFGGAVFETLGPSNTSPVSWKRFRTWREVRRSKKVVEGLRNTQKMLDDEIRVLGIRKAFCETQGGFKIELQQSIICDDNPGLSVGRQG